MLCGRIAAALLFSVISITGVDGKVNLKAVERRGELILICSGDGGSEARWADAHEHQHQELNLGPLTNDPRGIYSCVDKKNKNLNDTLQVHVRMCENCIELNLGTIAGILVADVVITILICVAVYSVSGSEIGRSSRASDKQILIPNDQLYQVGDTSVNPLRNREGSNYSHVAETRTRRK